MHVLVIIARDWSSRGSRRVILAPGLRDKWSISSWETSRVMGIAKRAPSTRRRVSTTLGRDVMSELQT